MEILKNNKNVLIITVIVLIFLYIVFNYNEESTNQEIPKRATFVNNHIGDYIYYV